MARETLPINPALLRWARERAGFTMEEMVASFRNFLAWEEGSEEPTYPQLEQLSDKLKLPVAVFFFPTPPSVPAIEETFRTLSAEDLNNLPSSVRLLLRKAKAFQINLAELTGGRNPAARLITRDLRFETRTPVAAMAAETREYIGISVEQQVGWGNDELALKNWRDALLRNGIFVFKDAFRVSDFSGFCLTDETFPIIFVNNSTTKTRQIFTLFHELAHLIFHTSGIDKVNDEFINQLEGHARLIEIICNRFAAEFLLPNALFLQVSRGIAATEETAEILAARYHVSREFIFRRFLDGGLIGEQQYEAAARRWAEQRQGGSGGDYYRTKISYLGRDYIELALKAHRQNRISDDELADYLDIKPRNLDAMQDYFERGAA